MSILSQAGIVILIGIVVLILCRSNKMLDEASKEGEHFVDDWKEHQRIKEEMREEKEKQKKAKQLKQQTGQQVDTGLKETHRKEPQQKSEREIREAKTAEWKSDRGLKGKQQAAETADHPGREVETVNRVQPQKFLVLQLLDEKHQLTESIPVGHFPFTIGRKEDNDLVLSDLRVARYHCRIVLREDAMVIEDLETNNKIYTDGRLCSESVLYDRQTFYIGNQEFRVEIREDLA